jgi:hypothetical protein
MGMSERDTKNQIIAPQIMSASLTMITVVAAFTAFIVDKREVNCWFYIVTGASFLALVVSIFLGGKGLSSNTTLDKANRWHNWQAISAILGIVLFCGSIFIGKDKSDDLEKKMEDYASQIIQLKTEVETKEKEMQLLTIELKDLAKQFYEIKIILLSDSLRKTNQNK